MDCAILSTKDLGGEGGSGRETLGDPPPKHFCLTLCLSPVSPLFSGLKKEVGEPLKLGGASCLTHPSLGTAAPSWGLAGPWGESGPGILSHCLSPSRLCLDFKIKVHPVQRVAYLCAIIGVPRHGSKVWGQTNFLPVGFGDLERCLVLGL